MTTSDLLHELYENEGKIITLHAQLAARGIPFEAIKLSEKTITALLQSRKEVQLLEDLLAGKIQPKNPVTVPAKPTSSTPSQTNNATLTEAEISQLSWTNQVIFAQGKMSIETARSLIAEKASKATPQSLQTGKTQNLTEQCIAANKGK